ncbi:MAG TPA: glycosyltransferase family A protein [Dongiaceae bacterium]|nr:glycosyltransferase family A protein [Dongiaceae bacterium]
MTPLFSVVLATYNRGRHIVPTIASALRQNLADFELIVVGDCCTDETEAAVRSFGDARIAWRNLPERAGSQSTPNNTGIGLARGRYIAYLGHDDIWAPDHLNTLQQCFAAYPEASFAVGGCVFYGPAGSGRYHLHGLFEDEQAPLRHFFPPSSIAHRRQVPDLIGPWRQPGELRQPIDLEFMQRAFHAGLRFVSSRQITVHKFAAGHRYLSYMRQESQEQELLLRMMSQPGFADFVAAVRRRVEGSTGCEQSQIPDFSSAEPGEAARNAWKAKGILRPPLQPLAAKTRLRHESAGRALDWGPLQRSDGPRRRSSGPNPRPKLLVPVTSAELVDLHFHLLGASDGVLERLRLSVNGNPVPVSVAAHAKRPGTRVIRCTARLNARDYSIVQFDLTGGMPLDELMRSVSGVKCQIVLGAVWLRPRSWVSRLRLGLRSRLMAGRSHGGATSSARAL